MRAGRTMANTSTAPAPQSFARRASSWYSGDTRSTTLSMAVFTHSAANTAAMQRITAAQEAPSMRSANPSATASTAMPRCIFMLRCVRTA